ncbi:rhodanese-like domain-containing protein 4, chloroplastic-like [Dorcoceras hygrometricum]|uniref:Rhodanese-like domain-containing protein 4, chloroplastic-like n=1 Tax=Dorcoceras hygrometricum TaxID=472368 RepID=A0A2Z7AJE2_9LAMI|nr:rhodanese-like domain-containing protein 4, chloroplastic-like [Dorcoceras hygrometricum]
MQWTLKLRLVRCHELPAYEKNVTGQLVARDSPQSREFGGREIRLLDIYKILSSLLYEMIKYDIKFLDQNNPKTIFLPFQNVALCTTCSCECSPVARASTTPVAAPAIKLWLGQAQSAHLWLGQAQHRNISLLLNPTAEILCHVLHQSLNRLPVAFSSDLDRVMEALKAVGLTPISVLDKRSGPRKYLSPAIVSPFKNQSFTISRCMAGGLVLLSSALGTDFARALTYDETLQQPLSSLRPDIDATGIIGSVTNFAAENPLIVGGGVVFLAFPLVVSQLLSKSKNWGVETAKSAYSKLGDDDKAQLLDIRAPQDIKQVGSPDIRSFKKKPVALEYNGEDKSGFLKKLSSKFKEPESTTLFILDKFDGNSELVAELVTANGFKAAYAIRDGAEGSRGWTKSDLPWIAPSKAWSLDLSNLTGTIGDGSDALPLILGVAAAAGIGILSFTEVEVVLQVLGSAALIQFVGKKLLFAEVYVSQHCHDRKQTIQQIEDIVNTKIAPNELVGDIKQIGRALLPSTVTTKALPAPAETAIQTAETAPEGNSEPAKVEATPEVNSVPQAEAEVNSVPQAEAEDEPPQGTSRPLSPYPNYPDYKPPSSPIPSQP